MMKTKIPARRLVILSGNDTDTLWWWYRREIATLTDHRLYDDNVRNKLVWIMDEMQNDPSDGYLVLLQPTFNDLVTIRRYKRDRQIEWYLFVDNKKGYTGSIPEEYYLYEDGRYIGFLK